MSWTPPLPAPGLRSLPTGAMALCPEPLYPGSAAALPGQPSSTGSVCGLAPRYHLLHGPLICSDMLQEEEAEASLKLPWLYSLRHALGTWHAHALGTDIWTTWLSGWRAENGWWVGEEVGRVSERVENQESACWGWGGEMWLFPGYVWEGLPRDPGTQGTSPQSPLGVERENEVTHTLKRTHYPSTCPLVN